MQPRQLKFPNIIIKIRDIPDTYDTIKTSLKYLEEVYNNLLSLCKSTDVKENLKRRLEINKKIGLYNELRKSDIYINANKDLQNKDSSSLDIIDRMIQEKISVEEILIHFGYNKSKLEFINYVQRIII